MPVKIKSRPRDETWDSTPESLPGHSGRMGFFRTQRGLIRSLFLYYGVPFRVRRMRSLYRTFLSAGDLAFDIGAHVGNRVRIWNAIGVHTIAVEPQPSCIAVMRRLYGKNRRVTIVPMAVGSEQGTTTLYVSDASPTLTTTSRDWAATVKKAELFSGVAWDTEITVPVTTIDRLIDQHGEPAFVKIDVEGSERAVLDGLTRRIRAVSFEFLPAALDVAFSCLDRMTELGAYEYNLSRVETMRFEYESWVDADAIRGFLSRLGRNDRSGDVYARLTARADDARGTSGRAEP